MHLNGWDVVSVNHELDREDIRRIADQLPTPLRAVKILTSRHAVELKRDLDGLGKATDGLSVVVLVRCQPYVISQAFGGGYNAIPRELDGHRSVRDYLVRMVEEEKARSATKRTANQAGLDDTKSAAPVKRVGPGASTSLDGARKPAASVSTTETRPSKPSTAAGPLQQSQASTKSSAPQNPLSTASRIPPPQPKTLVGKPTVGSSGAMKVEGGLEPTSTPPPDVKPTSALPAPLRLEDLAEQLQLLTSQSVTRALEFQTSLDGLRNELAAEKREGAQTRALASESQIRAQQLQVQVDELRASQSATSETLQRVEAKAFAPVPPLETVPDIIKAHISDALASCATLELVDASLRSVWDSVATAVDAAETRRLRDVVEDPSNAVVLEVQNGLARNVLVLDGFVKDVEALQRSVRDANSKSDTAVTVAQAAQTSAKSHREVVTKYTSQLNTLRQDVESISGLDPAKLVPAHVPADLAPISAALSSLEAQVSQLAADIVRIEQNQYEDGLIFKTQCDGLADMVSSAFNAAATRPGTSTGEVSAAVRSFVSDALAETVHPKTEDVSSCVDEKLELFETQSLGALKERMASIERKAERFEQASADQHSKHEARLVEVEAHFIRVNMAFCSPARGVKPNPYWSTSPVPAKTACMLAPSPSSPGPARVAPSDATEAPTLATTLSQRRKSKGFNLFNRARSLSSSRAADKGPADLDLLPPSPNILPPPPPPNDKSLLIVIPPTSSAFGDDGNEDGTEPLTLAEPSPLFRSLALLDSRLASMESLGFPTVSSPIEPSSGQFAGAALDAPNYFLERDVPGTTRDEEDDLHDGASDASASVSDRDDTSVEMARALRAQRTSSLSAFQLPDTGRDSGLFGKNMLWEALGLSADEELDFSSSLDQDDAPRSLHRAKAASIDSSTGSIASSVHESISSVRERSQSSSSTVEEVSEDIFNLSEFPAFDELPSFSSSETPDEVAPEVAIVEPVGRIIDFSAPPESSPPSTPLPDAFPSSPRPRSASPTAPSDEGSPSPRPRSASPAAVSNGGSLADETELEAARAESPAFEFGASSDTDEDGHDAAHDRLAALVLANLGLGSDPNLAGLGFSTEEFDATPQAHSRSSSSLSHGLSTTHTDCSTQLPYDLSSNGHEDANEPDGSDEDEDDDNEVSMIGTALTTSPSRPTMAEQALMSSTGTATGLAEALVPLPSSRATSRAASVSPSEYSPSVRGLHQQGSLPAIFRRDPTVFHRSDAVDASPPPPPRAAAMELGSPVTLSPSTFIANAAPFTHGASLGHNPRSPSAASFSSVHSASPRTPKTPTEIYGASLGQLRMTDETEFPIWDQPSSPLSRANSPPPVTAAVQQPRSPLSEAPAKVLRSVASSKSLKEDAATPNKRASRRMSFSLRRRKSDVGLSTTNEAAKEFVPPTPALPIAPPLVALVAFPLVEPIPPPAIEKEVAAVPEPTPAQARMKRKSRLSLFIPRFGKKQPATPAVPSSEDLLPSPLTSVSADGSSLPGSLANTPNLMASPGGTSPPSPTFPSTPTTDSPAASYFVDSAETKGRDATTKSSPFGDEFAFLSTSPTPRGPRSLSPSTTLGDQSMPISLTQFVPRPVRSSSVFPQTDIDYTLRPLPSTSAADPAANDITVFPVVTPVASNAAPLVARSLPLVPKPIKAKMHADAVRAVPAPEVENSDQEDAGEVEVEDDVPLGSLPGALKMQKSLRLTARKPKAASASASASGSTDAPNSQQRGTKGQPEPVSKSGAPPALPSTPAPSFASPPPAHSATMAKAHTTPVASGSGSREASGAQENSAGPARPPKPIKSHTMDVHPSTSKVLPNLTVANMARRASNDDSPKSSGPVPPPRPPMHQLPAVPNQRAPIPALHNAAVMDRSLNNSTSSSTSSARTTEHRIFINNHATHILVTVSNTTRCGEIVAGAKSRGALTGGSDAEGGWALFEICRALGVERPIREYELIDDVVKSWDQDSNILIIRRTPLWPTLSAHLIPQPAVPRSDWVQFETKKGKWAKRYLTLKDGAVSYSKGDKGKDPTQVCQLVAFDVFFVAPHVVERLKAPKPFVFALKSLLPRAHYEKPEDYCYFVSVKTAEDMNLWVKCITEARNVYVRQRETAVLGKPATATSPTTAGPPAATLLDITPRATAAPRVPSRPPPSSLSLPTSTGSPALASGKAALQGVMTSRPSATVWSGMSESERHNWLKNAEREARTAKASFLEFGSEDVPPAPAGSIGVARGNTVRR